MPEAAAPEMRLTTSDARARRLATVALLLMGARGPVRSGVVHEAAYASLDAGSFERTFLRDRTALAGFGLRVVRAGYVQAGAGREATWAVDEGCFWDGGGAGPAGAGGAAAGAGGAARLAPETLPATDALAVDVACRPLVESPEFAQAGELCHALAKVNRAFGDTSMAADAVRRPQDRCLAALRGGLERGHAVSVEYVDARGRESERTICPYGFYGLREHLYVVAGVPAPAGKKDAAGPDGAGADGAAETGAAGVPAGADGAPSAPAPDPAIRTFRLDRMRSAKELARTSYQVPAGFRIEDWCRLPFQMGPATCTAVFHVPPAAEEGLAHAAMGQGTFRREDGRTTWEVWASSEADAAAWAVAMGLRPLAPQGLVDAWRATLEGVLAHA